MAARLFRAQIFWPTFPLCGLAGARCGHNRALAGVAGARHAAKGPRPRAQGSLAGTRNLRRVVVRCVVCVCLCHNDTVH